MVMDSYLFVLPLIIKILYFQFGYYKNKSIFIYFIDINKI